MASDGEKKLSDIEDVTAQGSFGSDQKVILETCEAWKDTILEAPVETQSKYSCNFCKKRFVNTVSLGKHIEVKHEPEVGFFPNDQDDFSAEKFSVETASVKPKEAKSGPEKSNISSKTTEYKM